MTRGASALWVNRAFSVSECQSGVGNVFMGRKQKGKQDYCICVKRSIVYQKKETI